MFIAGSAAAAAQANVAEQVPDQVNSLVSKDADMKLCNLDIFISFDLVVD
jgi:hypothetical protein